MIDNTPLYDFNQVLFVPTITTLNSRKEVVLERSFTFSSGTKWTGVPIISANMYTTGTFEVHKELSNFKMLTALHKFYTLEDFDKNIENIHPEYCIISTGIRDVDYDLLCSILDKYTQLKWICIDIANGYIPNMTKFCKRVRTKYPNHIIIGGNVATPDMTEELCKYVDIVKIGIGPGSVCTTRKMTGVGFPQLSCIMNCSKEAKKHGKMIVGDGGITCPGDVSKAFGGGAEFVMMGGVFAGHDENPGNLVIRGDKKYKQFYGMSSGLAMKTHYGKQDTYRASEGKVVEVPYKGYLKDTIQEYLGGIRSTCTYINAQSLEEIHSKTKFIVVQNQLNNIFS